MKKFVNEAQGLLPWFVTSRLILLTASFLILFLLPGFAARFPYADLVLQTTNAPQWIWGFGNFDGVHYLRIAQRGYAAEFTQAFFPAYPVLIRAFSVIFPDGAGLNLAIYTDPSFFWSGLLVSNVFFFLFIVVFYKLAKLDYGDKNAKLVLVFLLVFPTAFYMSAIYSESLFFFLIAAVYYSMRKGKTLLSSIFVAFAGVTRVFGVLLVPIYLIYLVRHEKITARGVIGALVSATGILGYMAYLQMKKGDFLYFFTVQPSFGAERSGEGIVFPLQVVYRYFKIFYYVPWDSLPFFNAFLEFGFFLFVAFVLLVTFRRAKLSYWLFVLMSLLLPSLTGTFSSQPRYALTSLFLFPVFIELWKSKFNLRFFNVFILLSVALQVLLFGMFIKGYWVA